ncbi:MAG: hypothetical protein AAF773_00840 [Cyanobacteria bacterium P01_D01_bin.115]
MEPLELAELAAALDIPTQDVDWNSSAAIAQLEAAIEAARGEPGALSRLLETGISATLALAFASGPGIRYVINQQRYLQGRTPVPDERIERWRRQESAQASRESFRLGQQYLRGDITLQQFERRLGRIVVNRTLRSARAGAGGSLNDRHRSGVRDLLYGDGPGEGSLRRIPDFMRAISAGEVSDAQFLQRSRLYGANTHQAYALAEHINRAASGAWEARRTLGANQNHCPDCPALISRGWQPANEVTPRGIDCRCQANCLCQVTYRRVSLSDRLPIPS